MKYLLLLSGLTVSIFAHAQTESPVDYMQAISEQFNAISSDMMSYTSAAAHGKSARKVDKKRSELLLQIKESERNVRKMKPFNGSSNYRDAVIEYFRVTYIVLNEDYAKILDMEEIAEQSYDLMEQYMLTKEKASEKINQEFERVQEEKKVFAANNNVNLISGEESKLSLKIKTAGEVSDYYHTLFLLFFKSYKNEIYLLEAINKGDLNAMEQNKNALLASATEDYVKTGPIESFKGDATVKNACQQMLNFYKMEASQKIPQLIEFELVKENYEKMKTAMDAKRPNERTKKDIDDYNAAINTYNKQIQNVNAVHNDLNKKRSQLLDNWNNAVDNFFHKHTPKYR